MKTIASNNFKATKKKNKAKLKKYWKLVYPPEYVALMVAKENVSLEKQASSKLKPAKLTGTIKQTKDGFVYVNLSNDIIHGLFACLNNEKVEKPPYFEKDGIGAHISLISDDELDSDATIEEIGQTVDFSLGDIYYTKPEGWDEMEKVWFVTVKSPDFKKIRKRYDLPPTYKDKGHDFHITFAVEKK